MSRKTLNTGFLQFVYDFYREIRAHEITLAYEGEMNHQLMKVFTNITMGRMSEDKEKNQVCKKVYHVMIECLQNISKHAFHTNTETREDLNHGILIISKNPDNYLITTGNIVEIKKIEFLENFLKKINSLGKKELDHLYRNQLKEGKISEKGGAGLGFIDIKRKTGQALDFHFLPLNRTHSFFLFSSRIKKTI
ncbi:MAG: SiaB family protein kinase [Bacteroidota bacterium]